MFWVSAGLAVGVSTGLVVALLLFGLLFVGLFVWLESAFGFSITGKSSARVVSTSLPVLSCLETTVVLSWILSSNLSVVKTASLTLLPWSVNIMFSPLWVILENWYLVLLVISELPFASLTLKVYWYLSPTFSTFTSFSNKLAYVESWALSFDISNLLW